MSAIVELVKFTAADDLPAALLPVLKSAGNADGHLKVFHGVTVEDKAVGYIVLLWDSKDAFTHWPARAEFEEKSRSILSQSSTLQIQFEFLVAEVFEAPVTEFALAKLKDEANRDEYNSTADSLAKMMSSKEKGGYAPAFGPVVEGKEADVVIIIGWDSPEAHANAVKDEPGVGKLFELAHLKVIHVPFTKLL